MFLWVENERHRGPVARVQKPRLSRGSRVAAAGDGVPGKVSGDLILLRSQVLTLVLSSHIPQLLREPREGEKSVPWGKPVKTVTFQLNPSHVANPVFSWWRASD